MTAATATTARLARNTEPRRGMRVVAGSGAKFRDADGAEYVDLSSQTVNLLFGQAHPVVNERVAERLAAYTFFDQDFGCPADLRAIQRLHTLLPSELVAFNVKMCNGSDAVESAVKQARRATGRSRVLTIDGIYLGQSTQAIHFRGLGVRPTDILRGGAEDVVFAPLPYCRDEDHAPLTCARENGEAICALIDVHRSDLACVLIDPIMVSSGVFGGRAMATLLRRVRAHTEDAGIPLIFDECQTFGWVPDLTLARHWGVTPDAMVLGKGIAAGFPLSICASQDHMDNLQWGEADYTHGGHPAAIAAMEAICGLVTDPIQIAYFDELVAAMDATLARDWAGAARHRGIGLIRGLELRDPSDGRARSAEYVRDISNRCLRRGVYVRPYASALGIKPPRTITVADLTAAIDVIHEVVLEAAMRSEGAER